MLPKATRLIEIACLCVPACGCQSMHISMSYITNNIRILSTVTQIKIWYYSRICPCLPVWKILCLICAKFLSCISSSTDTENWIPMCGWTPCSVCALFGWRRLYLPQFCRKLLRWGIGKLLVQLWQFQRWLWHLWQGSDHCIFLLLWVFRVICFNLCIGVQKARGSCTICKSFSLSTGPAVYFEQKVQRKDTVVENATIYLGHDFSIGTMTCEFWWEHLLCYGPFYFVLAANTFL